MRWWLFGMIPIVNAHGPDIDRSAAGRVGSEMTIVPSTLLLDPNIVWEDVDETETTARVTVGAEEITLHLHLGPEGKLQRVSLLRWRENVDDGRPGYDRFDVSLDEEARFDGYTIPTHIQAGWRIDEPDGFLFFDARLTRVVFR